MLYMMFHVNVLKHFCHTYMVIRDRLSTLLCPARTNE